MHSYKSNNQVRVGGNAKNKETKILPSRYRLHGRCENILFLVFELPQKLEFANCSPSLFWIGSSSK